MSPFKRSMLSLSILELPAFFLLLLRRPYFASLILSYTWSKSLQLSVFLQHIYLSMFLTCLVLPLYVPGTALSRLLQLAKENREERTRLRGLPRSSDLQRSYDSLYVFSSYWLCFKHMQCFGSELGMCRL